MLFCFFLKWEIDNSDVIYLQIEPKPHLLDVGYVLQSRSLHLPPE